MVQVPSDAFFEDLHRKSPMILPSTTFLRSVCRCLFGPVDHHQTMTDIQTFNERLLNEAGERWNFDFRIGEPVHERRYEWISSKSEEKIEEGSGLKVSRCSHPNQVPDNNCDMTTGNLNNTTCRTRPFSSPHRQSVQIPAHSVTSQSAAPAEVTASRDLDSDVIDYVSRDVDITESGRRVSCRRRLVWDALTMSRSATISGTVRRTKNRRKTTQKLVRTLAAQRSAITDYFPKTKASAIDKKPVGSRQRRLDNPSSGNQC